MTRDELNEVLMKISAIEGRQHTADEADAWYEILAGRSLADTLAATITFYSKPFVQQAYPGDINTLVEDIETERVNAIGDLEMNEADWIESAAPGMTMRELYHQVRKGRMDRQMYNTYRDSGLTLEAFLAQREVPVGG